MEYLLKASAIMALFYVCYIVFLKDETFFEPNRWFLLLGLALVVCMPLMVIPVYVEQTPLALDEYTFANVSENAQQTGKPFGILPVLTLVYGLGLLAFTTRFIFQITFLALLLFKSEKLGTKEFTFVKTDKDISPFSFFRYIVYNPNQFNESELNQILTHEKVHVAQWHSVDILLSQLVCIAFWFNPCAWLYHKALKQNLEFIADKAAVRNLPCKKNYQYTLLKTSMPTHQLALTNNFYNSLIKKRILMLHKSKSKKINLFKYSLIIPLLALFLMSFNTKEVIIEKTLKEPNKQPVLNASSNVVIPTLTKTETKNKNETTNQIKSFIASIEVIITKDFTDSDIDKLKTKFKNEGYTLKVKGVKRNKQGEIIAIKIEVNSKTANANYNIDTDEAISPIKISIDDDGNNISIRNAHLKEEKNTVFISKVGDTTNLTLKKYKDDNTDNESVFVLKNTNTTNEHLLVKIRETEKEPMYIVEGKEISKKELTTLNHDNVASINVLKGEKAISEYGDKGKNGVIVVSTKKEDSKNNDGLIILGKSDSVVKIKSTDGKEPLYILDGKEITSKEMKDIDPKNIEKVEVLKDDAATKKYGDKGKNGVVMITTKK